MKLLAILAIAVVAWWAATTFALPSDAHALTEADARDFTNRLIELTDDVDVVTFCDEFAADHTMCERSLAEYGSQPEVVSAWSRADLSVEPSHSGSMIVTFTRADGTSSAIEVLREEDEIRAVNPVFWAERTIVG